MREFVLLIKEQVMVDVDPADIERLQGMLGDYKEWMTRMIEEDRYVYGNRLDSSRRTLQVDGSVVVDGPYVEPKEMIGGVVILKAASQTEAEELAKSCPMHRLHEIDVRPAAHVYPA
ncbi:MAG: hypothetical protein KI790_10165 [Cyclobacteriaceae bacterium]|nr:hypothetical protein [Cyclobacteriaceae bacterium HetDA_MAG_MS6]